METLLSLTSKRAGDWFKEELRLLGGLDHIVDKGSCGSGVVCVCVYISERGGRSDTDLSFPIPVLKLHHKASADTQVVYT